MMSLGTVPRDSAFDKESWGVSKRFVEKEENSVRMVETPLLQLMPIFYFFFEKRRPRTNVYNMTDKGKEGPNRRF